VNIIFDSTKDFTNIQKHGVALADAALIEWDTLWSKKDTRQHYGEIRMIGYAYIGVRLFCVVYTDRDENRRIISLRKANKREVKQYASA
jgi:uncharacterized protein